MGIKIDSLIRKSLIGLAITQLAVTSVFAAEIAGPGNSTGAYKDDGAGGTSSGDPYYYNKTIEDAYGSTFQYGDRNTGFGTFTMGNHDTTLTAQWDAIHYAVTFDATTTLSGKQNVEVDTNNDGIKDTWVEIDTGNIIDVATVQKNHVPKEQGGVPYYRWYDVMDAANNTVDVASGQLVEQYSNIQVPNPGGDPKGTQEATGTLEYNLRYDKTYQLYSNSSTQMFSKVGYTLVGWSTRQPQQAEEMFEMASWEVKDYIDGSNCDQRIDASQAYAGANTDGTVADFVINGKNVLLADGGQFRNLSYGQPNEYVNAKYQTVTLYAIWAPPTVESKVYYTLQKVDGTYSYDISDTSNVIQANASYTSIKSDDNSLSDAANEIANNPDNAFAQNTWYNNGGTWSRSYATDSRVYKYAGDTYHDARYTLVSVKDSIYQQVPGEEDSDVRVDRGNIVVNKDNSVVYIKIPRIKVELTVYGMLQKNSNGYFYTQSKLKTDDGEIFGQFSVNAPNGTAYVETTDNTTARAVELGQSGKLDKIYQMIVTVYAGQNVSINNVVAAGSSSTGGYTYKYLGYSKGEGSFTQTYVTNGPAQTSNQVQITVGNKPVYVQLFFNKEEAPATPLKVRWHEMTRTYNDPYGIGVGGQAYSKVDQAIGPWQNIQWKNATVGTGQTTNKVYYMQIWLDNTPANADKRDRLNIQSIPSNWDLELHQYHDNKDLVVVRFNNGISELELQNWLRNQFAVISYSDPGSYTPANDRVKIFITNVQGYNRNDTGKPTIYVDGSHVTINNFYVPSNFSDGAHLMFDDNGPDGTKLYWVYEYEEEGTVQSGPEGSISAGDRGGHNYAGWDNRYVYPHASYTMSIPQYIVDKCNAPDVIAKQYKSLQAQATVTTYNTIDNKYIVALDGNWYMENGSNGSITETGPMKSTNGGTSVTFDLWAGDQSEANTAQAYGEDHGATLHSMIVKWYYYLKIRKTSPATFREDAAECTTAYTIPVQYPVVIKYDGSTAWKQDPNDISTVTWSNVPGDNVSGFDPNWIFGYYVNGNDSDYGNPCSILNYKYTFSDNVLTRYGYVWDGHWYTVYDPSKIQYTQYNWLTNRLNGAKGTQNWDEANNNYSLLKYNKQFGNIANPSSGYSYAQAGDYDNSENNFGLYPMKEDDIAYKFNSNGYVPVTKNETSTGDAVTVDYSQMIQLWLQSGAQYDTYNISDAYTNGQKPVTCRIITLYAARTVPIQYTIKYVSGGTSDFGSEGQEIPYSWSIDESLNDGSINDGASATDKFASLADSHALNAKASGVDTSQTNYGSWYRQQFVYDDPETKTLSATAFQRPNGGLTVGGQSLDGYDFIGWTVYKDETGNNDNASYRKDDTRNDEKDLLDTVKIAIKTQANDYTLTSGTASQIVTIQKSSKTWNGNTSGNDVEAYNISENNEFFLKDKAVVRNLLGVVQTSGSVGEVNKSGQNVAVPALTYSDSFKWPEVVLYPNWIKEVNLTIDVDPNDIGLVDQNTSIIQQEDAYGKDVMYNNTLYYPINIDRVFNNFNSLQEDTTSNDKNESWRGSAGYVNGDKQSNKLVTVGDDWFSANGSNEIWNKTVLSTVKDKDSQSIETDYRFLGLQFSNREQYPATSKEISETMSSESVRLPSGAITNAQNEKALEYDKSTGYKFYTHPRKYALQVYDTDSISRDADDYDSILDKFFSERTNGTPYVGQDTAEGYLSTIDCYNNTMLYGVWEPILTASVDLSRVGYSSIRIGYPEEHRVTAVYGQSATVNSKAGTGMQIVTAIDGIIPKGLEDDAPDKEIWGSESYKAILEYRYNDNFTNEIVNLYKDPIAQDPKFQTVLDTLNNAATWIANQRDGETAETPKIVTPHSYQSWSFYLPLYLGTDEMNKASGGQFVYSPSKVYEVDLISSRYSFYYQNYIPDSEKDAKYPNNETVIIKLNYMLDQASKPDYQDPDLNPTPTPTPTITPDPGEGGDGGTTTPTPTPTPTPSYPADNPDGGNDGQSVLDDLRVHVQLH